MRHSHGTPERRANEDDGKDEERNHLAPPAIDNNTQLSLAAALGVDSVLANRLLRSAVGNQPINAPVSALASSVAPVSAPQQVQMPEVAGLLATQAQAALLGLQQQHVILNAEPLQQQLQQLQLQQLQQLQLTTALSQAQAPPPINSE